MNDTENPKVKLLQDDTIKGCHFWLQINVDNCKVIPVGEVSNVEELDSLLGRRRGKPPITYLGLLWSPGRNAVEERFRKRSAKRQYQD